MFYAQWYKLPVVWDQIQSNYSDKLVRLDIKRTKMISELAAKHRQTAEMKLKLIRIVCLHGKHLTHTNNNCFEQTGLPFPSID